MAREERVWTTKSLLDELAARKNIKSGYGLAKYLEADPASVSLWNRGARVMSDDWGIKLAQQLQLDPAYVCLCLAAERSTDANLATQMRAWLVQHASAAVLILSVFTVSFACAPATAHASEAPGTLYIMLNIIIR